MELKTQTEKQLHSDDERHREMHGENSFVGNSPAPLHQHPSNPAIRQAAASDVVHIVPVKRVTPFIQLLSAPVRLNPRKSVSLRANPP